MYLRIEHSRGLSGTYVPQGNKNEALPVLAATLMCPGKCRIGNLPRIIDVQVMLDLLRSVGAVVESDAAGHEVTVDAGGEIGILPDEELAGRIRGSLLLAAPILARRGEVVILRPGGDRIGRRRIDTHLDILESLGAEAEVLPDRVRLKAPDGFRGKRLFLEEASVMATENALMAACAARGDTVIENAACEPHVQRLAAMLKAMGVAVEGAGTNRIEIEGRGGFERFRGVEHRIREDHIEVGSLIALAAATESEIAISGATPGNYRMVERAYRILGVRFVQDGDLIRVPGDQALEVDYDRYGEIPRIHDAPWPGFPADLSSIAVVLACCARGSALIHEWMFESRLYWVDSLISMGARITQCDPHRVLVNGGRALRGTTLHSPDIRAGMALLIAALRAEGRTTIHNVIQIDRGYEAIDRRLAALGAKIERVAD